MRGELRAPAAIIDWGHMATIRVAARKKFTTVDRNLVQDERLSYRARGVLIWLLDKPDDWKTDAEAISRKGKEGRDAIRAALRELEDAGYLNRLKWRDPKTGKWQSEQVLYDEPQGGFPAQVNQRRITSDGEPAQVFQASKENTDSTTETNTDNEDSLSDNSVADEPSKPKDALLTEEHWRLANLLADEIAANGNKRPTVGKTWAHEIRLMMTRDGRTAEGIEKCIRWCQADAFWHKNILSVDSLRKKYDRLRMDAKDKARTKRGNNVAADGKAPKSWENLANVMKREGVL